jgi:hypothetical protein
MKTTDYNSKVNNIINYFEQYHSCYYETEIFSGPSLYFHQKSIQENVIKNFEKCIEYIYATLASWGMHGIGSKMNEYKIYKNSLMAIKDEVILARKMRLEILSSIKFDVLEKIFKNINVMASNTILVGNSKVMANLLPNLIPPIDRRYTLKYIIETTNITNDKNKEWNLFKDLLLNFFNPIASNEIFLKRAKEWLLKQDRYEWDTSIPKIIDNLVIGAGRYKKKFSNYYAMA